MLVHRFRPLDPPLSLSNLGGNQKGPHPQASHGDARLGPPPRSQWLVQPQLPSLLQAGAVCQKSLQGRVSAHFAEEN